MLYEHEDEIGRGRKNRKAIERRRKAAIRRAIMRGKRVLLRHLQQKTAYWPFSRDLSMRYVEARMVWDERRIEVVVTNWLHLGFWRCP